VNIYTGLRDVYLLTPVDDHGLLALRAFRVHGPHT